MSNTDIPATPEVVEATVAKLKAEAAQALAEAARAQAEAEFQRLEIQHKNLEVTKEKVRVKELQEAYAREHAQDKYHHVYRYSESVSERSVKAAIDQLTLWHRLAPGCGIEIVFDSPGGSVIDGMDFFDFIQELRRDGHRITTATRGMAASMAGILLQAGDERVMGAESYILIHQIQTGVIGKIGEIKDEVKFIDMISNRVLDIFASRSKEAADRDPEHVKALTKAQLKRGWERKDWWIDSETALKRGLCDKVR